MGPQHGIWEGGSQSGWPMPVQRRAAARHGAHVLLVRWERQEPSPRPPLQRPAPAPASPAGHSGSGFQALTATARAACARCWRSARPRKPYMPCIARCRRAACGTPPPEPAHRGTWARGACSWLLEGASKGRAVRPTNAVQCLCSVPSISAEQEQNTCTKEFPRTCVCWPASWLMLPELLRCAATTACSSRSRDTFTWWSARAVGARACACVWWSVGMRQLSKARTDPPLLGPGCAPADAAPRAAHRPRRWPRAWCSAASPAERRQPAWEQV